MPSDTAANALIQLYHEPRYEGAPWIFSRWQEITGIIHGLFPSDDALLPRGLNRQDSNDIRAYFQHYKSIRDEESKKKFLGGTRPGLHFPGRKKWNAFVNKHWEKWGIHDLIVKSLKESHTHPIDIIIQCGTLEMWPDAGTYLPMAIDMVGVSLFGLDAFGNRDLLPEELRRRVTVFCQRTWTRIRRRVITDRGKLEDCETLAIQAFESNFFLDFIADSP
jgi:hypothetical protein